MHGVCPIPLGGICRENSGNNLTNGLPACQNHQKHILGCGYIEGDEAAPCTHLCELCKPQSKAASNEKNRVAMKVSRPVGNLKYVGLAAYKDNGAAMGLNLPSNGQIRGDEPTAASTTTVTDLQGLQAAITNARGDTTIELGGSITGDVTTPDNSYNYTIDLKGNTLTQSTNAAITHEGTGTGTVTILSTGSAGKVDGNSSCAILNNGSGKISISGTAIITSANTALASGTIHLEAGDAGQTSLEMTGGTVKNTAAGGVGILNTGSGNIIISNGAVSATADNGCGIFNNGTGTVTMSGGKVSSTAGVAIFNYSTGKISIGGTAKVASANTASTSGTIHLEAGSAGQTSLEMTGGTVENTATDGVGIWNNSMGDIVISSGSPIVKGMGKAMNKAPKTIYATAKITASTSFDGSAPVAAYKAGDIGSYKYLNFGSVFTIIFDAAGGSVSPTSSTTNAVGKLDTLPTPSRSGHSFVGWFTAASNGTQVTAGTTFIADTTLYAYWTPTGGGGDGGDGDGDGDGDSDITVIPPTPGKPNSPIQGEIKVYAKVDNKGNATVSITNKNVIDAFDKALAAAKKNGNEQNGTSLVLHVVMGNKTASGVTVNLPKDGLDTIITKEIVNVVVDSPDIKVSMDLNTVKEIRIQANADVRITANRADTAKLTADAKAAIGSRPVFDLGISYGSNKTISSFGEGLVSVSMPYTLGANEKADRVSGVYVDAGGNVQWLTDSAYDSTAKALSFSTNHFSIYGVGYRAENLAFTDIASHWAEKDIELVVSRGLFNGTSNTTFEPNLAMTRGMFVTVLGRLANADISRFEQSGFSDVGADSYYMGYIEWARENDIVNGSDGRFMPDQGISNQQMAVIMQKYAKSIGFTLPELRNENVFADNNQISSYAKASVKAMQMAGILNGKDANLFDPQGTTTRAQVCAVIHRFIELGTNTAQGQTMNASDEWMYYENSKSKAAIGRMDIDGLSDIFNQNSKTADVFKKLSYTTPMVVKNEGWGLIAKKYGCSPMELARVNNKGIFHIIYPGDVLKVPQG